jgi:hypothetical protein
MSHFTGNLNIVKGNDIISKVSATNSEGTSAYSLAATAVFAKTVPD